jgi:hypothetical protein
MANKFQLSVKERLEQEAHRQQAEPAPARSAVKTVVVLEPEPASSGPSLAEEAATHEAPSGYPDIGDFLRREPQRMAKNKTFYLDAQVIEAIKSTAKEQKVTDSKLVNDILRMVLLRERG